MCHLQLPLAPLTLYVFHPKLLQPHVLTSLEFGVHNGAYVKNGFTVTQLVGDEVELGGMSLVSSAQISFLKIQMFTLQLVS